MSLLDVIKAAFSDPEPTGKFDVEELMAREKEAEVAAQQGLNGMREARLSYDTRPSASLKELGDRINDVDREMREVLLGSK